MGEWEWERAAHRNTEHNLTSAHTQSQSHREDEVHEISKWNGTGQDIQSPVGTDRDQKRD